MNYRHAFHAGNFADCMKHALLLRLLRAIQRKPGGVMMLDTHAGLGRYDLSSEAALRTGEWRDGIGKVMSRRGPALADYVERVEASGLYPGSPLILRSLMRAQDRLVCCELHPEDHRMLKALFKGDAQVAVHRRDAWEAVGAFLPPAERRALVLIDPPYEAPDEFDRLARGVGGAWGRFRPGVLAGWYPVKGRAAVRRLWTAIREAGVRDVVAAELWLREPLDAARLNGCGLLVVNPPFGFEAEAREVLAALHAAFASPDPGAGFAVERLVDE